MKFFLSLLLAGIVISSVGCGGSTMPSCGAAGILISPPTATVNHAASPPGNSESFVASPKFPIIPGCPAITAAPINSNWSVSDPSVHLSATQGTTITATCTAALTNPATVTATSADSQMLTGTAALTCN